MVSIATRRWLVAAFSLFIIVYLWRGWAPPSDAGGTLWALNQPYDGPIPDPDKDFFWRRIEHNYPVDSFRQLPENPRSNLPKVQAKFRAETAQEGATRLSRRLAIKESFDKAWSTYKQHAWLSDEVAPISGKQKDTFGGWGATLIDSLDTLWIMGMKEEFDTAVDNVDRLISFESTRAKEINVFETTIRFLGGLLSAYDMSGDPKLLSKARDAGDMLYKAFDTPNHLPLTRWNIHAAAAGEKQSASERALLAEIGSLTMEFTRLSLITKDPKYFDAVQHISELFAQSQMSTKLPGLWPVLVDAKGENLDIGKDYTLGGMADSMYEYLPKMIAILGESDNIYGQMYTRSMNAIEQQLLFRPMTPENDDIIFPGTARTSETAGKIEVTLETSAGHLTCFAGGMFGLGGRLISNESHVELGNKATKACVWAYSSFSNGVMPEIVHLKACPSSSACQWDDLRWHEGVIAKSSSRDALKIIEEQRLPKGFTGVSDSRYILRPEAIESVFIMYRITGDPTWREKAWEMWTAIDALTSTDLGNSAVADVNPKKGQKVAKTDSMESFWLGETLKYFYLIFSEPDLVSLDDWVFNTEAHPFRRLKKT